MNDSRESNDIEYTKLLQNLPGMAYRCSNHRDWPMDFVTPGCYDLCGYTREEIESGRVLWGTLIVDEDRERIWTTTQAALSAKQPFEYEYRILHREGEQRWVWERGQPSDRNFNQNQGVRLIGIISDITERKEAMAAVADAVAFSNAIVDTAVEAIITIDAGGRIETFNKAAQNMFGYGFEDVVGSKVEILMPEPYHSEHHAYLSRYLETGEPRIIGASREVRAQRSDGSVFPIMLAVSEIDHHLGRKFVGVIRDLSAQRNAERAARQHLDQLAHVDRLNMLGEMASGIAHEINQPLTAISLFSQAGKRLFEAEKLDQLAGVFDKLSEHAYRAGEIIERMQMMAKQGDSLREVVDCNALVDQCVKFAEADARVRDVKIEINLQEDLPSVYADPIQVQQVALNLLRNAMEAMQSIDQANGNVVKVRTLSRADGMAEIRVIDSGTGVAEDVAATLFDPFSTSKKSGMGLGLALSRTIVEAHGGELSYSNNESGGATFYFTLPQVNEEHIDE